MVVLVAFALGLAAGSGALLWWQERPATPPPTDPVDRRAVVDEHAIELVLFDAAPPRRKPEGAGSGYRPLRVDGAVLLSGLLASTVLRIETPARGLRVRAPALPVRVTPTARFQPADLRLTVRDCDAATRWTPTDRPFIVEWRDERGLEHVDRAGDFDRAVADGLTRYVEAVCDAP